MKNDQTIGQEAEAILKHPLYPVLLAAINQAMYGKGQRHGGATVPFEDQPIFHYAKLHGRGFLTGQAAKKLEEAASTRDGEAFIAEVLGAIVYCGAAIMREREAMKREKDEAIVAATPTGPRPWPFPEDYPAAAVQGFGFNSPEAMRKQAAFEQDQRALAREATVAAGVGYLARSGLGRGEQDRPWPFPEPRCNCAGSDSYGHAPWCRRSNRALDRQPPVVNACSGRDVQPQRNGNQGPVRVADAEAPPAPGPEPVTDCLQCAHLNRRWDQEPCYRCSRNTRTGPEAADMFVPKQETGA